MIPATEHDTGFNPFSAEFRKNPYPSYRRLRERSPAYSIRGCRGTDWVLSRYHDIRGILLDTTSMVDDLPERIRLVARQSMAEDRVEILCRFLARWLFFLNAPEHTQPRYDAAPHFSKTAISSLEGTIRIFTRKLIQPVLSEGRIDIVETAKSLPCLVAAHLLGISADNVSQLLTWAIDLFSVFLQPAPLAHYIRLSEITEQLREYILNHSGTSQGLLGALMERNNNEDQVVAMATMLLSVGQETTQHLIGNAMLALLKNPEQMTYANEKITLAYVKELARYDSPVQMIIRLPSRDLELHGQRIRTHERLHLLLGSANRDEEMFAQPDRLDLLRAETSGLIFGAGPHTCLGLHLALLTTQVALQTILEELKGIRLVPTELKWIRSAHMRGLVTLPCEFDIPSTQVSVN